jgi:hypothetical protein
MRIALIQSFSDNKLHCLSVVLKLDEGRGQLFWVRLVGMTAGDRMNP